MVDNLLSVLRDKDDSAYQCFLSALDMTNQRYLRRILEEKGQQVYFVM